MIKLVPDEKTFYRFLSKRLDSVDLSLIDIKDILEECLNVTYNIFKFINNKYYRDNGSIILNTAHSSQMVLFYMNYLDKLI